ncbi:MAG: dihydrodipicolinate synthase family protein, partial [Lewinella sp.]|nr:dihydrodipicolinate synthase family protein [Lewinella sp.]
LTVPATVQDDVELERYLFHFAENSDIPLGIYECPFPRHYHLGLELIQKLADSGRFVAYKETSCELDKILSILEITENSKLDLLQANVPFMLEATQAGVPGSMNVVANWLPDLTIEVWKGGRVNDPSVEQLNASLCAMELAQRSVHPSGVKYLMSKRGLPIKPYTRLSKKLTKEEARGLDIVSGMWFQEDGSLTILK